MSTMGSHCSFGHMRHKLWSKERPGVSLTPDQKKSRIDPIYLAAEGMQHTIENLLMRAITLFQTTFQSEVYSQSYGAPKSRESQLM
jgi:hypothetical protein